MSKGWQVSQIPSQQGRRAIVTGGNSGIGYPTALELARAGADVLIATRDRGRGEEAVARVRHEAPGARVAFEELDLASLESVRRFAERELAREAPLHLLINNAGVTGFAERRETQDGFELVFGTNVLGHFALTGLLWPALTRAADDLATAPPRVVTIASLVHKLGQLDFENLQLARGYSLTRSYSQSKLANLMLALELDRRLRACGSRVRSVSAHPGMASTNLAQGAHFHAAEQAVRRTMNKVVSAVLNTAAEGAVPTLYAATAPDAEGGGYFGPQSFFETRGGDAGAAKIAGRARDGAAAARLWSVCEALTGVRLLDDVAVHG